jgi:hypothetical protein
MLIVWTTLGGILSTIPDGVEEALTFPKLTFGLVGVLVGGIDCFIIFEAFGDDNKLLSLSSRTELSNSSPFSENSRSFIELLFWLSVCFGLKNGFVLSKKLFSLSPNALKKVLLFFFEKKVFLY